MWHRPTLNEVAVSHGLPTLDGHMSPTHYLNYAVDLMLLKAGQLKADGIARAYKLPYRFHPYSDMGRGT